MSDGPVDIQLGKVIGRRWKIIEKLGEGGCGSVYLVEDTKSRARAALKAESNFVPGGSVLKLEVQVLRRMIGKKYVAQLIASGKKEKYCYMVMTLFGHSLAKLFKACKREFTLSTQVRLGMQMLYGLKQLHEVGFVHRDLKPANLAVGRKGKHARVLHLLDFGLSREYIIKGTEGKPIIRAPRENTLFRGTTKYCSANSHTKAEQGRPDDLWSMLYVLAEMKGPLPWDQFRDKHEIGKVKHATTDEKLLAKCPKEFMDIANHLRELDYYKRPDYAKIFGIFEKIMSENDIHHSDQLDWEKLPNIGIGGVGLTEKKSKKKRIQTIAEDVSVDQTAEGNKPATNDKTLVSEECDDEPPFTKEEFEKNEIGF
uniref:Protein kinase domain-containing protein n=1 Tax=Panagrellus redivivus TaxID=6233 RepID=A0A7E4UMF9_PANRE